MLEAHQVRNTIEALVKSGAIDGELATAWKQKLADETKVKETRARGASGLPKDPARARYWLKKVVDGECEYKILAHPSKAKALQLLRELESGGE